MKSARLIAALSLLVAAPAAAEKREEASFDKTVDGVQVQVGQGATVPATFPKDVPVYPEAKVLTSVAKPKGEKTAHVLSLETSDSPSKIVGFYRDKLEGRFRVERELDTGNGYMMVMSSEDRTRVVTVTATSTGKQTMVQLVVGSK